MNVPSFLKPHFIKPIIDALLFIENQNQSQIEIGIINDSILSLIEEGYTSSGELISFETTFTR